MSVFVRRALDSRGDPEFPRQIEFGFFPSALSRSDLAISRKPTEESAKTVCKPIVVRRDRAGSRSILVGFDGLGRVSERTSVIQNF